MQTRINDWVLYSEICSAKCEFEWVDLNKIIQQVIEDLQDSIEKKSAHIECHTLPVIKGDPTLLYHLFSNLIDNGLKFGKPGEFSEVILDTLSKKGGYWKTSVADRGIGLESKFIPKVFAPLFRLHSGSEFQGNGFSLALCKKIMTHHGGQITIDSLVNNGTMVILTFPENPLAGQ